MKREAASIDGLKLRVKPMLSESILEITTRSEVSELFIRQ